jgi:hypothetical protein
MCLSLVYLPILLDEKQNKNKMEEEKRSEKKKNPKNWCGDLDSI